MHLDLDEWLIGARSWPVLFELVDRLPQGSCYWAAVADDDELAAAYLQEHPKVGASRPALRGWSSTHDLLAAIADRLESLRSALGVDPQFELRPQTAIERVRKQKSEKARQKALAWLFGE